jgi:tetratricopeptide (TPR) repeat protein
MPQRLKVVTLILSLLSLILSVNCRSQKSSILVIGTIHGGHDINENYSYQHLVQILASYDPDVICVEIRPKDFRKTLYLKEMVTAAIYGLKNGKKVYPIDWWDDKNNARVERREYMKSPEYQQKKAVEEELLKKSHIIEAFSGKYGEWKDYSKKEGYLFFSGKEYNDFIEETYRISMEVFGDHCMNLYYRTRNQNMLDLILKAVSENKGKKVIVLTGAEHKHFFDRALAENPDIVLDEFIQLLPLKSVPIDDEINEFWTRWLARQYFDTSTREGIDSLYKSALTPLVHGPDMDFKPEIIPLKNIEEAKSLLDEWIQKNPDSIILKFEQGWYHFLKSSYQEAINSLEEVIPHLDQIPSDYYGNFITTSIYRILGFCYDLTGKRTKAVECYFKGEELCDQLGEPAWKKKHLYAEYKLKPYTKK